MLYRLSSSAHFSKSAVEPVVEGTEEIGFRVPYSPVSPVGSLDCFRDRLQHSFPDLRSQSQGVISVCLRLLSMRMRLNTWPKASRDDNQFANLVLMTRDGGDKP